MADKQEIEIIDPEQPEEVVSLDLGESPAAADKLGPEMTLELLRQAGEESYLEEIDQITADDQIQKALAERQRLAAGGNRRQGIGNERTALSPAISGGDVDAAWDQANVGGAETVGGDAPTPDQDQVDKLGVAAGLTYADDEPLAGAEKIRQRDEHRWELAPESQSAEGERD